MLDMKYDATEEELQMIEHGKVTKTANSSVYIACSINGYHHYLTVNREVKKGSELVEQEAYHDNVDIAKEFLAEWIKSKEMQEKKEEEIQVEVSIKRYNRKEFKTMLKGII